MKKVFTLVSLVMSMLYSFAQSNIHLVNSYPVKSKGGWDYIIAHAPTQRIYVSHGTQVNILNATNGDSVGVIEGTTGVHGIAFADEFKKGYTSNGRLNNVFVFDIATNKVEKEIKTGENPDAIFYDAFSKKVITCNGRSKDLTFIDAASDAVVATVPVGGKPETAVSDNAGKIYVNIEDKSEIVVIDAVTFKVLHHWSIAPCEEPTGLAIDIKNKKLFAGCGNKLLAVVDAVSGRLINKLPIGDGCDGVAYDASLQTVYASNGQDGNVTVITGNEKGEYAVAKTVITKKSARTICVDETTHKVYLPAADVTETVVDGKKQRQVNNFQVLVLGDK